MLDASALNAYVLYALKNPISDNRTRRLKLAELAINLIKPHVEERVDLARSNRFSGYDSNLVASFKRLGFNVQVDVPTVTLSAPSEDTRRRCNHLTCKLNKNNNKYANICSHCSGFFCKAHSEKMTTVICSFCIQH